MKRSQTLIIYLLLNIIISALTMMAVLWIWNRVQHNQNIIETQYQENCPPMYSGGDNLPPPDQQVLEIKIVYSPGNLQNEIVVIRRIGDSSLMLAGWQLVDENGNNFTFPALSFNKGEINIHSTSGDNSAIDLYWGLPNAVWQTGEIVRILDYANNERGRYIIP